MTITVTSRKVVFIAIAIVAVLVAYAIGSNRPAAAAAAAVPAQSAFPAASDGVTVTGSGTVSGTPDTLHLALHVTVSGADVTAALAEANRTAKQVQDAIRLRELGDRMESAKGRLRSRRDGPAQPPADR